MERYQEEFERAHLDTLDRVSMLSMEYVFLYSKSLRAPSIRGQYLSPAELLILFYCSPDNSAFFSLVSFQNKHLKVICLYHLLYPLETSRIWG